MDDGGERERRYELAWAGGRADARARGQLRVERVTEMGYLLLSYSAGGKVKRCITSNKE